MARKKKVSEKRGGDLEVKSEFAGAQGKNIVAIGADVDVPRTGTQKIRTKMGTVIVDENGLLIGAVVRGGEEDDS